MRACRCDDTNVPTSCRKPHCRGCTESNKLQKAVGAAHPEWREKQHRQTAPDGAPAKAQVADERTKTHLPHNSAHKQKYGKSLLNRPATCCAKPTQGFDQGRLTFHKHVSQMRRKDAKLATQARHHMRNHINACDGEKKQRHPAGM